MAVLRGSVGLVPLALLPQEVGAEQREAESVSEGRLGVKLGKEVDRSA